MTKFLNISTDNTLGGNSPSDVVVSSQKAIKDYVDSHGGSVSIDNLSITQNSGLQIQTVGVINSRDTSTAVKTWTGTKAQYDAIVTKDSNTLYNITDDTDVSLTILEALYPVGSVYITTASTCPLSTLISGSTWTLVSSGRVLQGADNDHSAGTTISAGLPNITGGFNCWWSTINTPTGAFIGSSPTKNGATQGGDAGTQYYDTISLNASASNPIYGNSNTVQPPAYVVNIFERIA